MREREHYCDNREHGQIASGPREPQSFAEPEDSKRHDDDANAKLERIFRHSCEWAMDCDAESDDY